MLMYSHLLNKSSSNNTRIAYLASFHGIFTAKIRD